MGREGGFWQSHNGKYYFDRESASDASAFFPECLTHHKGEFAGRRFDLEPWEKLLIILPVFGWKHAETKLRRFRKVYIEIPKKNGKSQFCAGLGVYMTFCDGEMGAEVVCAAADREQAGIVFDEAKYMIEDNDELLSRCTVYRRSVVYHATRSTFKVLSADARTKHGPNVQCLIIDEFHAQPNRDLFETLEKGIAARRQPLILMITTAGNDTESICYEQHEYAEGVMKDGGDESFLPVLFNLPRDAKWYDIDIVANVNPSIGVTVKREYFEGEIVSALRDARKQNSFKQLHCNIWTQQAKIWIPIEKWDACKVESIDMNALRSLQVAGGMDLSSKIDLSSFVLAFKHSDSLPPVEIVLEPEKEIAGEREKRPAKKFTLDFSVTLLPFFWMPEESLTERKKKDRYGYDIMKDRGLLEVTPGETIHYDSIYEKIIDELAPLYKLRSGEIGYDPWNALQLSNQLSDDGFKMIEIPQTMNHLTEASKVFEAMVLSRRIRHNGHPVLRWCIENVGYKEDNAGNIRPVKVSAMKRIDGVIASVLALSRLLVMKESSGILAAWIRKG